jgi:hypothetical protein
MYIAAFPVFASGNLVDLEYLSFIGSMTGTIPTEM